jgi:hypothetical protein
VDAAEPPRIVFESPALCREGDRAEVLLRQALQPARAPGPGWVVSMRVERATPRALRAEGEIVDPSGAPVAQRSIAATSVDCSGLVRAVGVWASLVLDAEVRRAKSAPTDAQADTGRTGASRGAVGGSSRGSVGGGGGGGGAGGGEAPGSSDPSGSDAASDDLGPSPGPADGAGAWPAPAAGEPPSPEHDWYLHHEDKRALELGAGVFLMTGTGGGALAGPSAFMVIEAGHGVFLRPAVAYGDSLTSLPPSAVTRSTWGAARFDSCLRLPGLYASRHGMQLDVCGGSDVGYTTIQANATTTLPYFDLGPSVDLRGELGSRLSAVLRVVAGVNVLRPSFVDLSGSPEHPPVASGRLELAFSWDVR